MSSDLLGVLDERDFDSGPYAEWYGGTSDEVEEGENEHPLEQPEHEEEDLEVISDVPKLTETDKELLRRGECRGVSISLFYAPDLGEDENGRPVQESKIDQREREAEAKALCAGCVGIEACRKVVRLTSDASDFNGSNSVQAGMNLFERMRYRALGPSQETYVDVPSKWDLSRQQILGLTQEQKQEMVFGAILNIAHARRSDITLRTMQAVSGFHPEQIRQMFPEVTSRDKQKIRDLIGEAVKYAKKKGIDVPPSLLERT